MSWVQNALEQWNDGFERLFTGDGSPIYSEPIHNSKVEALTAEFDRKVGSEITALSNHIAKVEGQLTEIEDIYERGPETFLSNEDLNRAASLTALLDLDQQPTNHLGLLAQRASRGNDAAERLVYFKAIEKRLESPLPTDTAKDRAWLKDIGADLLAALKNVDHEGLQTKKTKLAAELRDLRDQRRFANQTWSQVHGPSEAEKARVSQNLAFYRL